MFVAFSSPATAVSFAADTTPEFIFQQGSEADLIFSCVDTNDFVCDASFSCNITVISPNSSILVDNVQATQQTNYFNLTLPETDTMGIHSYNVFCSNVSNAGAATELTYLVNLTGEDLSISKAILYIFILLITVILFLASLFGAVKIPWNNEIDQDGFVVGMNDLKYAKLALWFASYLLLIFITWLTSSISRFLELGMSAGFFNTLFIFLLILVLPVFIIVFLTGMSKVFNDKALNEMIGRNLRAK